MYASRNIFRCGDGASFDLQADLAVHSPLPPIALLFQHLDHVPRPESYLVGALYVRQQKF